MILKQLVDDHERIMRYGTVIDEDDEDEASVGLPAMYVEKPVQWKIVLTSQGKVQGVVKLSGEGKKDRGKQMAVPSLVRTVNIAPLLLADTPAYLLGDATDDKKADIKHAAFRELLSACQKSANAPELDAVQSFLNQWNDPEQRPALNAEFGKSDVLTFEVNGTDVVSLPAVQTFWAQHCQSQQNTSDPLYCLICGRKRPAVENMPIAIKGIPGGQSSGTALVSANANVFESYGLTRATTSPICAECAEKFCKSLNALLAGEQTRLRVGGSLVYAFWSHGKDSGGITQFLGAPDPSEVKILLKSYRSGAQQKLKNPTAFYALALSANAARAVVRDWLTTTIGAAQDNLAQWFAWQEIVDAYGQEAKPLSLFRLAVSLYRKAEDIEDEVTLALTRTALHGSPLSPALLAKAVMRCRVEQDITYERAALMTLILRSHSESISEKENPMTSPSPDDQQARICGRLLAILENLQQVQADGKINATLVDRFYGSASTSPASVFGTLLADAQPHLAKLRKKSEGAHYRIQLMLEDTLTQLESFPPTLNVRQQALFSLGYYHQRAAMRAAAIAARDAKKGAQTDTTDELESNEEEN